jgi:copper chaperone
MTQTLQLRVTGMTCGGCENAIRRTLQKLDGVTDVTASHRDQSVGVTYDSLRVSPATIKEKITTLGYAVSADPD